jgi:hypothetical protein
MASNATDIDAFASVGASVGEEVVSKLTSTPALSYSAVMLMSDSSVSAVMLMSDSSASKLTSTYVSVSFVSNATPTSVGSSSVSKVTSTLAQVTYPKQLYPWGQSLEEPLKHSRLQDCASSRSFPQ